MAIDNYPKPRLPISNAMWRYNAVGGETTLSGYDSFGQPLQYTINSEQFFLNGVMLVRNVDYIASTGSTITGITALSAGDFVEILTYSNFNVTQVPATQITGTVQNNQLQNNSITLGSISIPLGGTQTSITGLTIDFNNNTFHMARGTTNPVSGMIAGDLFWNTTSNALQIYNGTMWTSFAPPGQPFIGTAIDVGTGRAFNNASANISFTPNLTAGSATSFFVTSNPGSLTSYGTSSPITITGLTSGTSYTFQVTAVGSFGNSTPSNSTGAIAASSVPQAPTIGTATATGVTTATVAFTAGATGGSAITGYTVTSSPGNITASGTSSPITINNLIGNTSYTFAVTATNINGTSLASFGSNLITTNSYPTVTGGTLSSDATYYYRTFTSSSSLTVSNSSLSADILVVAGGGSGGSAKQGAGYGGGGGAGGLLAFTSQSLASGNTYTCTVGAGGAGSLYSTSSGSNSVFSALTASVGGGGGGYINSGTTRGAPSSGGSGGGGSGYNAGPNAGAAGTSGQGNTGGTGTASYVGGGGGGAGAAPGTSPNGGIGATSALINAMGSATGCGQLSSGNYYFAGGGGGADSGIGGTGGGGNGATGVPGPGLYGAPNTGGGGGAGTATASYEIGYAGGSGIVIVRYTKASVGG